MSRQFHSDGHAIMARCKREQGGFLRETDLRGIAADPATRLQLVLVRCGGGRFLAPADQVQHFINIIGEHNQLSPAGSNADYVRDISIPATRD